MLPLQHLFFRISLLIVFSTTLLSVVKAENNFMLSPPDIAPPVVTDKVICGPSYITLEATGSTGSYRWYAQAQGNYVVNPFNVFVKKSCTFYVSAVLAGPEGYIESNRVPLNVNVSSAGASMPQPASVSICGSSHYYLAAIGAKSGEVYKWYKDSISNEILKISEDEHDNSFYCYVHPDVTYYVTIYNQQVGCESVRVPVVVEFKKNPSAPVVIAPVICGSGVARFEAVDEPGVMYTWYPCLSGCNSLSTNTTDENASQNIFELSMYNYNAEGISTYTIWVEKKNLNNSCVSERIAVTATSYKVRAPIVPAHVYRCKEATNLISAKLPTNSELLPEVKWYGDLEKQQLLTTGLNFSIPQNISDDVTVYAVLKDPMMNNCESEPSEAVVTIHKEKFAPTPYVSVTEACGKVIFDAYSVGIDEQFFWYSLDTLHTIYEGNRFTNYTNSTFSSDVFYVVGMSPEGCVSKRVQIQGRAKQVPAAPEISSVERCGYGGVSLKLNGIGKYTACRWYDERGINIIGEYGTEYKTPYLTTSTHYSASYIGTNGCESEKAVGKVTLKPGVSVMVSNNVVCSGESVALYGAGANFYIWSENGINLSNWSTIYVNPTSTSIYTLTDPTITGVCKSVSITIWVRKQGECTTLELADADNTSAGQNKIKEHSNMPNQGNVYPNPFTEQFFIPESLRGGEIRLYDLMGNELFYFPEGSPSDGYKVKLASGVYLLEIKTPDKVYTERIVRL